jgi:hypothetical protein
LQQWFCEPRFIGVDGHFCEFEQFGAADAYICREQAPAWCDDLHAHEPLNRPRKPPCIGEFSAEIEPAAERENVAQRGIADLHLSREFKGGVMAGEQLRATAACASG